MSAPAPPSPPAPLPLATSGTSESCESLEEPSMASRSRWRRIALLLPRGRRRLVRVAAAPGYRRQSSIEAVEEILHPKEDSRRSVSGEAYFGVDALIASVEKGAIAPLRGKYLKFNLMLNKCHQYGGSLPHRQQIEAHRDAKVAFWSGAQLRELHQKLLDVFIGKLGEDAGRKEAARRFCKLFVAVSYRWAAQGLPDQDHFNLRILADVAGSYLVATKKGSLWEEVYRPCGYKHDEVDFCVFWDFVSLYQRQYFDVGSKKLVDLHRTEEQAHLFSVGLKASNVWYGHKEVVMWMQTTLPPKVSGHPYSESGWCYTEKCLGSLLKNRDLCLDLGRHDRMTTATYGQIVDRCVAERSPPVLPSRVLQQLEEVKLFTSTRADVKVVAELYDIFFSKVSSSIEELRLAGLNWRDAQLEELVEVLASNRLTRLRVLDLGGEGSAIKRRIKLSAAAKRRGAHGSNPLREKEFGPNAFGVESTAALAAWLGTNTTIQELDLHKAGASELDYFSELRPDIGRKSEMLLLRNKHLHDADAVLVAGLLATNDRLKILDLSENPFGPRGEQALALALKTNSTLTECNLNPFVAGADAARAAVRQEISAALRRNMTEDDRKLQAQQMRWRQSTFLQRGLGGSMKALLGGTR